MLPNPSVVVLRYRRDERSTGAAPAGDRGSIRMQPQLNHLIVHSEDKHESARFLAGILGLDPPLDLGYFVQVETGNGVAIDFADDPGEITPMHLAFLVTEREFDEIFGRIRERELVYWADPSRSRPGEINVRDGGRGVYFADPDGHLWEVLTRPYGSGPTEVADRQSSS